MKAVDIFLLADLLVCFQIFRIMAVKSSVLIDLPFLDRVGKNEWIR